MFLQTFLDNELILPFYKLGFCWETFARVRRDSVTQFNSVFFSVEGFRRARKLSGISSSVSRWGPYKALAYFFSLT